MASSTWEFTCAVTGWLRPGQAVRPPAGYCSGVLCPRDYAPPSDTHRCLGVIGINSKISRRSGIIGILLRLGALHRYRQRYGITRDRLWIYIDYCSIFHARYADITCTWEFRVRYLGDPRPDHLGRFGNGKFVVQYVLFEE